MRDTISGPSNKRAAARLTTSLPPFDTMATPISMVSFHKTKRANVTITSRGAAFYFEPFSVVFSRIFVWIVRFRNHDRDLKEKSFKLRDKERRRAEAKAEKDLMEAEAMPPGGDKKAALHKALESEQKAAKARVWVANAEAELASAELDLDRAAMQSLPKSIPPEAKKTLEDNCIEKELKAKKSAVAAYDLAEEIGVLDSLPKETIRMAIDEDRGHALISAALSDEHKAQWNQKSTKEQLAIFYTRKAQYEMIPKIDEVMHDNRGGLGGMWLRLHQKYGAIDSDCLDESWSEAMKLAMSGQSSRTRDAVKKIKSGQANSRWTTAKHMSLLQSSKKIGFAEVAVASATKSSLEGGGKAWGTAFRASSSVTPESGPVGVPAMGSH